MTGYDIAQTIQRLSEKYVQRTAYDADGHRRDVSPCILRYAVTCVYHWVHGLSGAPLRSCGIQHAIKQDLLAKQMMRRLRYITVGALVLKLLLLVRSRGWFIHASLKVSCLLRGIIALNDVQTNSYCEGVAVVCVGESLAVDSAGRYCLLTRARP